MFLSLWLVVLSHYHCPCYYPLCGFVPAATAHWAQFVVSQCLKSAAPSMAVSSLPHCTIWSLIYYSIWEGWWGCWSKPMTQQITFAEVSVCHLQWQSLPDWHCRSCRKVIWTLSGRRLRSVKVIEDKISRKTFNRLHQTPYMCENSQIKSFVDFYSVSHNGYSRGLLSVFQFWCSKHR